MNPGILIVDDDYDICAMIAYGLMPFDCEVEFVTDGAEAIFLMAHYRPAILILDLNMPFLDGEAVLAFVRSQPDLADMKVIMVTVYDILETQVAQDVDYFIRKPYILDALRSTVGEILKSA